MNELQVFNNEEFGEVRSVIINDEPYFVGKDVAVALGYKNTTDAIRKHVDNEDKIMGSQNTTPSIMDDLGRIQYPVYINESGIYALIFGSRLKSAKKFKHWVTSEVLPAIRKTGGYIPTTQDDSNETILSKALLIAQNTILEKDALLVKKTKALDIAQPKADKYDKLMNADGFMSFNVVAKQLGTGRNRLMKVLRDKGVLFRDGLSNIAYQMYCDRGYFVVKYSTGKNGFACGVTKVTPKGLDWLCDVLNEPVEDVS